jgi:hypothetical protein
MSTGKRKRFSKNTATWGTFEKLFLDPTRQHPTRLGPFPKGKVVNLVQGLNCCNIQWAEDMQMPLNMLTLSAKAVKGHTDMDWFLEVSTNYRQQGLTSPRGSTGQNWVAGLLDSLSGGESLPTQGVGHSPYTDEGVAPQGESPLVEPEEWVDPQDDLLNSYLKGEK